MGSCLSVGCCQQRRLERAQTLRKEGIVKLSAKRQKLDVRNNLLHESFDGDPSNDYEVVKQLGVGSMGSVAVVRRVRKQRHQKSADSATTTPDASASSQITGGGGGGGDTGDASLFAMKTLKLGRLTGEFQRELENEIRIVRNLDHPHIVKFHHIQRTAARNKSGRVYIVMDYCSGGDLYRREPYTEAQAARIMKQLLSAVGYMHQRGYVHRDLKVRQAGSIIMRMNAVHLYSNLIIIAIIFFQV